MPRWLWWMPLVVLMLVAGLLLFRQGWVRVHLTETDVINHYAAHYVAQAGGEAEVTDCVGQPGKRRGVWLVIRCLQPGGSDSVIFAVDRAGRLVDPMKKTPWEPRT